MFCFLWCTCSALFLIPFEWLPLQKGCLNRHASILVPTDQQCPPTPNCQGSLPFLWIIERGNLFVFKGTFLWGGLHSTVIFLAFQSPVVSALLQCCQEWLLMMRLHPYLLSLKLKSGYSIQMYPLLNVTGLPTSIQYPLSFWWRRGDGCLSCNRLSSWVRLYW